MRKPQILIIDDNEKFVSDLSFLLQDDFDCQGTFSGEEGLEHLEQKNFDLILLDIDLGESMMNGFQFLDTMKDLEILIPVIIITKFKEKDKIVKAIKKGAFDYVRKKEDLAELKIVINRAIGEFSLRKDNIVFREEFHTMAGVILGESESILNIKKQIVQIAQTDSTVLITGENGTGKELVARQIHKLSLRKDKPFIAVNCAAIPENLSESELFGHEKGAFTGAYKSKPGKFEFADEGTIFLDEIADMKLSTQAKLLRVLQEKTFERVGGQKIISVDVRIIAATNKNLKIMIEQDTFREDLYYRLNVFPIHVPPLREHRIDIAILAKEFIRKKRKDIKKNVSDISPKAINMLVSYDWPGNVRELENVIERAIILSQNDILTTELFPDILNYSSTLPLYATAKKQAEERFQWQYITAMFRQTKGNIKKAAELMGITRHGLQKIVKGLNIDPSHFRY